MDKILYLINPKANNGQAANSWKRTCQKFSFLPSDPIDINQHRNLADVINKKQPEIVAVGGGDGTVNLVAQAVLKIKKPPVLTIIPLGFGNALSYCFGVETIKKALQVIKKQPETVGIDVLKTNVKNCPIGLFSISVGFDAQIVHKRQNALYSLHSYFLSALDSFLDYQPQNFIITVNNQLDIQVTAVSIMVSNAPIIGKNLVVSHRAHLNDGLLECTIFPNKLTYVNNLRPKGISHPLYSEQGKVRFKTSKVKIKGEKLVQIDGDPFEIKDALTVEIHAKKLCFLKNTDSEISQNYQPFIGKNVVK